MSEIDAVLYEQYQSIHIIYMDLFCFQASTALCILCHLCLQLNKKCCASEHHLNPVRLPTGDPAVTDRGGDGPDSHWGNLSMRGSWLQRQPNKGLTLRLELMQRAAKRGTQDRSSLYCLFLGAAVLWESVLDSSVHRGKLRKPLYYVHRVLRRKIKLSNAKMLLSQKVDR